MRWLAKVKPRRGDGSTKLVASIGSERPRGFGSREDLADEPMPWTTDKKSGSSETAGRNRYPRYRVTQGEFSPMLKPLTLSLSLAVALGLCSVSKAGLHDNNCTTCGLASPQGVVASPQGSRGLRRSPPAGRSTTSAAA